MQMFIAGFLVCYIFYSVLILGLEMYDFDFSVLLAPIVFFLIPFVWLWKKLKEVKDNG